MYCHHQRNTPHPPLSCAHKSVLSTLVLCSSAQFLLASWRHRKPYRLLFWWARLWNSQKFSPSDACWTQGNGQENLKLVSIFGHCLRLWSIPVLGRALVSDRNGWGPPSESILCKWAWLRILWEAFLGFDDRQILCDLPPPQSADQTQFYGETHSELQ